MNVCTFIGNSGADAKLEYTPSGMAVCKFSIAVSEKKGDQFESTWFDIVLFKDLAERKQPMIRKGSRVFVSGKMTVNEWTDKTGNKRKNYSVMGYQVEVVERAPKLEGDSPFASSGPSKTSNYGQGQNQTPESPFSEMDIPF